MPFQTTLPDEQTFCYRLLELVAISGEFPMHQLSRLKGGEIYKQRMVYALNGQGLLHPFCRDGSRGLRLTIKAKRLLLERNPQRFSSSLTGCVETNCVKSELSRRYRLHRVAEATVTMMNAGVAFLPDEKSPVFSPVCDATYAIDYPCFYNSREMKDIGLLFQKMRGSRAVGALLTCEDIFLVYNLGDGLMKWEYQAEMRAKALMKMAVCRERLSRQYFNEQLYGLLLSNSMAQAYTILSVEGGYHHFVLDGNFDHVYYLTNDRYGERLLTLLTDPSSIDRMDDILRSGLLPREERFLIENDAFTEDGHPVLFAYLCDLPRIQRFDTALRLQNKRGVLVCFDFQQKALSDYCGHHIDFDIIDFNRWETHFFA